MKSIGGWISPGIIMIICILIVLTIVGCEVGIPIAEIEFVDGTKTICYGGYYYKDDGFFCRTNSSKETMYPMHRIKQIRQWREIP